MDKNNKDIIGDILGHNDKTININGTEFKYRALEYREYLKGLKILINNTGVNPDMDPEEVVASPEDILNTYKHRYYVLGIILEYNGYDKEDLMKDIRLLDRLNPLYEEVVEISQPDEELIKKKGLDS